MADPSCPIIVGDAAVEMTNAAYARFQAFANETYAQASEALDQLSHFVVQPVTFNASFDPQIALSGFTAPVAPVAPNVTFNAPTQPPAPPLSAIPADYQPTLPPVDTSVAPVINDIPMPVFEPIAAPGAAPAIEDFTFPDAPELEFPDKPSFFAITLPDVPNVVIPTFDSAKPLFDAPIPDGEFSFTPTEYTSAFLDQLTNTLSGMVNEPGGLPIAVAQALRDRAMVEADTQEARQVQQAYDEYASRGFCEPSGLLTRRVTEARQAGLNARSAASRDVYIQEQQVLIENLRFAITTGVSLESQLMNQHVQFMQMSLEAAKYTLDVAMAVFNARVSAFNAQVQAYATDAAVFRDLIQGELAKVQVYTAQLDGQRLIVEMNSQQVQIYEAELRAVATMVQIYTAQVQAVSAEIEGNKTKIDAYAATVNAYAEQFRAQSTQVEAFRAQVEAEGAKVRLYEVSTEAFSNRVRAWSETEQLKISGKKLSLDYDDARIKQWQAQVELFDTQLKGELARISSTGQIFSTQAEIYRAAATVASAAAESDNRAFQLNLAQEQAIVDTELKRADFDLEQLKFNASTTISRLQAIAQISSQLTSAAMSAVNFHAGVSSSLGQQYGCNTNISYSGSLDNEEI